MRVIALGHALTSGARPAAAARSVLARHGSASARASVELDRASGDPVLSGLAREGTPQELAPKERKATQEEAARFATQVSTGDPRPTPAQAVALLGRLLLDASPEASRMLASLFASFPALPAWKEPLLLAFRALLRRGDEPVDLVRALLRGGDANRVDLALVLMPLSRNRAYIPAVEACLADPGAIAWRGRARRLLAFLYADGLHQEGGLPPEQVLAFARELRRFAEDPDDPSSAGLIGALLELGPAGEAQIASALGGSMRAVYVEALSHAVDRPVGLEVIQALLAPVTDATPLAERRAVLVAIYEVASAEAAPLLEAVSNRLSAGAAEDVETVRRIVRQRSRQTP